MATAIINADRALSIFISTAWFPTIGKEGVLYFAQDTEVTYRWDVNSGTYVQFASAIAGVTDHGLLTGLADDDHPQYALDTDLSDHVAAADPHPVYALDTDLSPKLHTSDAFSDFVVSGLLSPTSDTLTSTLAAGVAYVTGLRVVVPATVKTYTASKDTYVDLSSAGVLTYVEVVNGAGVPAVTANNLRLQKVVTSGAAVTAVTRHIESTVITLPTTLTLPAQPFFRAYVGTAQVIATGSSIKILYDTVTTNIGGGYSGANSWFIAPVAGVYLINASLSLISQTDGGRAAFDIYVNGVASARLQDISAGAANDIVVSGAAMLNLTKGDKVEATVYLSPTSLTVRNRDFDSFITGLKVA